MPELVQDGLTLEERFFARIAAKNGLVSETDLALATRERVASGRSLPEVLRSRGLLTDAQIQKVREAQQASQIVQLDSMYADVLLERRLIQRPTIEEAFQEQRRRRYQVRLGELLIERRVLTPQQHAQTLDELLRRTGAQRTPPLRVGSTAERRSLRAEEFPSAERPHANPPSGLVSASGPAPSPQASASRQARPPRVSDQRPVAVAPPARTPPAALPRASAPTGPVAIPLDSRDSDSGDDSCPLASSRDVTPPVGLTSRSQDSPPPQAPHPASISFLEENAQKLGVTRDSLPPLPSGSGPAAPGGDEAHSQRLLASALALRLSSENEGAALFVDEDRKRISDDRRKVGDAPLTGDSLSDRPLLLDRAHSTSADGTGERFSPDLYLRRRTRRRRLLLGAAGLVALAFASMVGAAVVTALGHRKAFDDAGALVGAAEAASLGEQPGLYARARERLEQARGFGVGEARRLKVEAQIVAGEARAQALAALAGNEPKRAQAIVREALDHPHLSDEDRAKLVQIQGRADHDALMAAGREALDRGEWRKAVDCFRAANEEEAWQKVRQRMVDNVLALERRATSTLEREDRNSLAAMIKTYFEVWGDGSLRAKLDEVDFQSALVRARKALDDGDARRAIELANEAIKIRDGDAVALELRARAGQRLKVDEILDRARAHEQNARFDEALAAYREAAALTSGQERSQIERFMEQVALRQKRVIVQQDRSRVRDRIAKLVLASAWDEVLSPARELESLGDPDGAKLVELVETARGTILVPGGETLVGADDKDKSCGPPHKVTVAPFLIDRLEVSNKDYAVFVKATQRKAPSSWLENVRLPGGGIAKDAAGQPIKTYASDEGEHPVRSVTWQDAQAFAEWRKKRLPREVEWERAARGNDARTFPWGEGQRSNVRLNREPHVQTAACGVSSDDASPWGVRDLAGNVSEWCDDVFAPYPGSTASPSATKKRVIRGGSYDTPYAKGRTFSRDGGEETRAWDNVGFRCAMDLPPWLVALLEGR